MGESDNGGVHLISACAFTYNALIQNSFGYKVKPVKLMKPTFYSDRHYGRKLW